MRLHYYSETDSLYVEFKEGPGVATREVTDGLNVDLDAAGEVVGFDIDHASQRLDLSTLETEALPLRTVKASWPPGETRPVELLPLAHDVVLAEVGPDGSRETSVTRHGRAALPILKLVSAGGRAIQDQGRRVANSTPGPRTGRPASLSTPMRLSGTLLLAALLALGIVGPVGLLAQTATGFDSVRVVSSVLVADDANPSLSHNIPRLEVTIGGQTLTADFTAFYESSGGLTRWGLPTSEVFQEESGALTQYYQRGVVDFHPRADLGGIYVMERRLAWDYFGGGLAGSVDQGVEPGTSNNNSGEDHGPWGHKVSNFSVGGVWTGFLNFFRTYGGVDAFGFPKTEARIDTNRPGTLHIPAATPGFIRQYFQAAILEHHPGAGVRLRLLGDDLRNRLYPNDAWQRIAAFNAAGPLADGATYQVEVVDLTPPPPPTPTAGAVTPATTPTATPTATPAATTPSLTSELVVVGTTDAGLAVYDGSWHNIRAADTDLVADQIQALHVDGDGRIWVGTPVGASRVGRDGDGEVFTLDTTGRGLGSNNVQAIAGRRASNVLYVGHPDQGVSVLAGTEWDRMRPDNSELPDLDVRDIFVVDESIGRVWFATRQGAALYDQQTDTWQRFITRAMIPEVIRNNVTSVTVDSGGRLWLGLLNEGVVHSANLVTWVQVGTTEGLGSEEVRDLLAATNGDVWVATAGGVSRVVDGAVTTFTTGNSALPADGAHALAETADGRVWVATDGGVGVFDGNTWKTFTTADGLSSDATTAIAVVPAVAGA